MASPPQVLDIMGGDNVHAAEDASTDEEDYTCVYDIDVDTGLRTGNCLHLIDDDEFCMPCTDDRCDSKHCINGSRMRPTKLMR